MLGKKASGALLGGKILLAVVQLLSFLHGIGAFLDDKSGAFQWLLFTISTGMLMLVGLAHATFSAVVFIAARQPATPAPLSPPNSGAV